MVLPLQRDMSAPCEGLKGSSGKKTSVNLIHREALFSLSHLEMWPGLRSYMSSPSLLLRYLGWPFVG